MSKKGFIIISIIVFGICNAFAVARILQEQEQARANDHFLIQLLQYQVERADASHAKPVASEE